MGTNNKHKIVLTGGHAATTALSTIEELKKRNTWEYVWIGAKNAVEGKKIPTIEEKTFAKLKIPYYPIRTGRLQRKFTVWTIPALFRIPLGFVHAFYLLRKIKPEVILSFGGFSSVPVGIVGRILGIPLVIHEQTAAAGKANKLLAIFAKRIAISKKSSEKYFSHNKVVLTGNPIRNVFFEIEPKKKIGNPPTIFVFGGSRGAKALNDFVDEILEKLLAKYIVIHHTGSLDFDYFKSRKKNLNAKLTKRYEVYDFIAPKVVPECYKRADIMLCRAGANTVSEVIATSRPTVFIPLPWNYLDEQTKNAEYAKKFIPTIIVDQKTGTARQVFDAISLLVKDFGSEKSFSNENPDKNAAVKIADLLEDVRSEN